MIGTSLFALAVVAMLPLVQAHSESAVKIDPPAVDAAPAEGLQTAVIAGGCFWGIQAVYQHTNGVTKAISGYADVSELNIRRMQLKLQDAGLPADIAHGDAPSVRTANHLLHSGVS